jgi:hypothetical protein
LSGDLVEERVIGCPSCGEPTALALDTLAGAEQRYSEDCSVCCRPMAIELRCRPGRVLFVSVEAE